MSNDAKHIREGYQSISPYIVVRSAVETIEFYKRAFSATELMRLTDSTNRVRHAEIQIGDSVLMLVDEHEAPGFEFMRSAQTLGGSPIQLHLYVEDVDAVIAQALAAGAKEVLPVQNAGEDRRGGVMDPFGLVWWIATRIEHWSRDDIKQRFEAHLKQA